MTVQSDKDLNKTKELYEFLQGKIPDGCKIPRGQVPKMTPDQAWTVIWWLANQYWQVTDRVEKCDVCGDLYHTWHEGHCLDFGNLPYSFCESCMGTEQFAKKERSRLNPERQIAKLK